MNPRRARLQWALLACGVVVAVALALRVAGVADDVEFLATLLVAPVIAATLLVDRNLGYVMAGVAAVGYLYLRFDDIQDTGAAGVVVLVLFRAASYGGVAYVTPLLFARLAGVSEVDIGVPARHLRAEPVDPASPRLGTADWNDDDRWAPEPPVPAMAGPAEVDYALDPLLDTYADATMPAVGGGPGVGAPVEPTRPWAEEAPLDEWSAEAAALAGRPAEPPAPRVPTGWIDDATSPLGDETIPVGYTGELFLGRITGSVPVVPTNGARNGSGSGRNGSSAPSYADTEPLRPLDPVGAVEPAVPVGPGPGFDTNPGEHWSTRVEPTISGSGSGSGEHRSPWTARADEAWDTTPSRGNAWVDPRPSGPVPEVPFPSASSPAPVPGAPPSAPDPAAAHDPSGGVDPETRLWNAPFFRDRLNAAIARSQAAAAPFSVVMIQVPDEPFQPLPYRRQVALLRELGHQFVPRFVDHLVHLPDGAQHWFAVVLDGTDRTAATSFERRLRTTLTGYLRSRGLRVGEVQSASLTSPDDDEAMSAIWASLLGADNVDA